MDLVRVLTDTFGSRFREREPLARHTNFRIGGLARYYVEARTPEEVRRAVEAAHEADLPWFVLGGGSNTLVADAGFDGLVIQMAMRDVRIEGTHVTAGAGAITAAVARQAGEAGLTGFEWAVSLPGTIGGAVRGNAGCFGGETGEVVEHIVVLDDRNKESARPSKLQRSGGIRNIDRSDCAFRYRYSIFKDHPRWIILEVTLALRAGDPAECRRRMDEHLTRRKTKQPLERPSAGCLFTNVEVDQLDAPTLARLERETNGAWHAVAHDGQIPTGWLVQQAGCSGLRIGNAMVSERHGNFVINLGGATAADVVALAAEVQRRVRERFDIMLREEVQRVGFATA